MSGSVERPAGGLGPADISIVVPVGGTAPLWKRSVRSLAALDPAPGEILVVLDGPNEELARAAATHGVEVLTLAERVGPARARNHGARQASGEILLFLDSDVEVPPELAARVAEIFSPTDAPTAVIGSYDDDPGDPEFLSQYRNLLHHFVHQTGREQASTFWAGCGAIRRRAFLGVGGFDPRFSDPSIEDIELGSRLRRAGKRIRLAKDLEVKHLKRWRLGDMLATDLFRRAVPWTRLMLRDGRLVNDLNVRTRDRISVALALLLPTGVAAIWLGPLPALVAAAALLLLVILNRDFFRFLWRRRGPLFALRAVPAYWTYLLVCGLGFGLGLAGHFLSRGR